MIKWEYLTADEISDTSIVFWKVDRATGCQSRLQVLRVSTHSGGSVVKDGQYERMRIVS